MAPRLLQLLLLHHLLLMMAWQMSNGVLQYPKSGVGNYFTNMAVNEESVYLAENGKLTRLHVTDLSLNTSAGTCDSSGDCENVNKILLVNGSQVITCGTGNGGRCESRSEQLYVIEKSIVNQDRHNVLIVSSNLNRPAVGLILEGTTPKLVFGVTQGLPLYIFYDGEALGNPNYGYKYFISKRALNFERLAFRALKLVENQPYLIYFRHVFVYDGFVYFLTNQKKTIGNHKYVTKLISVCPNEDISFLGGIRFESYVDIMLTCTFNGTEFNLLQDADFIQVGGSGKLVGVFSQGNDPESPSADRAVCIFSMDDILETISAARKDYIVSPGNAWANTSHYIKKPAPSLDQWFVDKELYRESDVSCGWLQKPTVGNKLLSSNASYHSGGRDSQLTKIKCDVKYGSKLEVFAGTFSGKIIKLSWKGDKLHEYDTQQSEDSGAVRAIHHGDNYYLVLTDKKLYKYGLSDCSEYATCSDTMESLNPRCGWCVYSNRSTTKEACPVTDVWLPSLTECPKLTTVPQGIHTNDANQQVTVSIDNVNIPYNESYAYKCVFRYSNKEISKIASGNETNFTCEIPTVTVHELGTLQLWYNNQVVLAETLFWFYSCEEFKSCGECVSTQGAQCIWCPGQYICQRESDSCTDNSLTTTQKSECPSLVELGEIYIPNGIATPVIFSIRHINKTSPPYTCEVNGLKTLARSDGAKFACSVQVSMPPGKRAYFRLKIRYSARGVVLDDGFTTEVTVYRCAALGTTCGECRALRRSWYSCAWSAGCQYGTDTGGEKCPPPLITKIEPLNGPSKGNTAITISGTEFGSSVSSIQSPVIIGGHECTVKTVTTHENPDFDQPIPKSIVCSTSPCQQEKIGQPLAVTVSVDNQTSSNLKFTYLTPVLKSISPTKGPIAGDTTITLTGDHLGIGHIDRTEVDIDNVTCWSVHVALNKNSDQYEITCKTNTVSATGTADVVLRMDHQPYNQITFNYVANPIIGDLIPKIGFLSGGTLLTIDGINLGNAGRAEVTTVYKSQKSAVKCVIQSKNKVLCSVPPAPDWLRDDYINARRESVASNGHLTASICVAFDGVDKTFNMNYFVDPYIEAFNKIMEIESGGHTLMIQGTHLNFVAGMDDYTVTVGMASCAIQNLTSTSLECVIPNEGTTNNDLLEVNVTVGNINAFVGYVRYNVEKNNVIDEASNTGLVAGIIVVCMVLLLVIIGIILGVWKYRRVRNRAKPSEKCSVIGMERVEGEGGNDVPKNINVADHVNLRQQHEISPQNPRPDTSDINPYMDLDLVPDRDDYQSITTHPEPEPSDNPYIDLAHVPERDDHDYGTANPGPKTSLNQYMDLCPDRDDPQYDTAQQGPDTSNNAHVDLTAVPDTADSVPGNSDTEYADFTAVPDTAYPGLVTIDNAYADFTAVPDTADSIPGTSDNAYADFTAVPDTTYAGPDTSDNAYADFTAAPGTSDPRPGTSDNANVNVTAAPGSDENYVNL